jgi:hypothetical protein
MKWACALLLALPFSSIADKPRVSRSAVMDVEKSFEVRIAKLWPDDPVGVVGVPEGMYINGYGAVFSAEVNLAQGPGISPFHPNISNDDKKRIHGKKTERMPRFRLAMEDLLLSSAASLDTVPDNEKITLGMSFFYWFWEDTTDLPQQIVMSAPKRLLVMVKTGHADHAALVSAMTVQEF